MGGGRNRDVFVAPLQVHWEEPCRAKVHHRRSTECPSRLSPLDIALTELAKLAVNVAAEAA